MGKYVGGTFKNSEVHAVTQKEYDKEADDFGALFVGALEVPDAVADVTVHAASDESEKV